MLELVPSEIEKLIVVSPPDNSQELIKLDRLVRATSMRNAVLTHGLDVLKFSGLKSAQIDDIAAAWVFMRNRRQRVSQEG